jgi:hypothetical protein
LIPDLYTIVYDHESGTTMPRNRAAVVGEVDARLTDSHDVDIVSIEVSGALTINDAPPPASEFDDGIVWLRDQGTGGETPLGNTHDGSYTLRLVAGTYDLYYGQETAGGSVPENKGARLLQDLVLDASASLDLDVAAASLSGAFSIDGAPPPPSQYEDGRVYLRNLENGDALLLGSTHEGNYSALVVPGTYEIVYVEETGGDGVPANQSAPLGQVVLAGALDLDIEIPMRSLAGSVTVGGASPPQTPGDGGLLYLRDGAGDSVYLGTSYGPGYGANVVAGTYGVYYRAVGSLTLPQNDNGRFGCLTIP